MQTAWTSPPIWYPPFGPWNLVAGTVAALDEPDAVIVDELYLAKPGIAGVGDVAEINRGQRDGERAAGQGSGDGRRAAG